MTPEITAIDRASDALFGVLNASYDLIDFARDPRSFVPPATLHELMPPGLEPHLDPALVELRHLPRAEESWVQARETVVAAVLDEAGRLLTSYYSAYIGLCSCLVSGNILDEFTAARPGPVAWGGIHAPSPPAWVVALALAVDERIRLAAGLECIDLSGRALRAEDRGAILKRWPEVRVALAALQLPDRAVVGADLEAAVAVAAVAARTRRAPAGGDNKANDPPPKNVGRLQFDDASLTVRIDGGAPIRAKNPRAYQIFKAIAQASPDVINRIDIRQAVCGTKGDKTIRHLIDGLPRPLRDAVESDTTGFWLRLPPPGTPATEAAKPRAKKVRKQPPTRP
jgi:hypothetical protein